jgi:hypothetical protein
LQIIPVNEQVPVLTRAINRVVLCPAEKSIIYNRKDGALFVHNYETDDQVELSKQNMLGTFVLFEIFGNDIFHGCFNEISDTCQIGAFYRQSRGSHTFSQISK